MQGRLFLNKNQSYDVSVTEDTQRSCKIILLNQLSSTRKINVADHFIICIDSWKKFFFSLLMATEILGPIQCSRNLLFRNYRSSICQIQGYCLLLLFSINDQGHPTNKFSQKPLRDIFRLLVMYKDCLKRCFYNLAEFDQLGYLGWKLTCPKCSRRISLFQKLLAESCRLRTSNRTICSSETSRWPIYVSKIAKVYI